MTNFLSLGSRPSAWPTGNPDKVTWMTRMRPVAARAAPDPAVSARGQAQPGHWMGEITSHANIYQANRPGPPFETHWHPHRRCEGRAPVPVEGGKRCQIRLNCPSKWSNTRRRAAERAERIASGRRQSGPNRIASTWRQSGKAHAANRARGELSRCRCRPPSLHSRQACVGGANPGQPRARLAPASPHPPHPRRGAAAESGARDSGRRRPSHVPG